MGKKTLHERNTSLLLGRCHARQSARRQSGNNLGKKSAKDPLVNYSELCLVVMTVIERQCNYKFTV